MPFVQEKHRLAITTPLGKDVLLLRGFNGTESLSSLFQFDLDLLSEHDSISFQDVVGKNVTLKIDDANGVERHWNGFISRFSQGTQDGRLTSYYAQMVPWLWFLTRTADCRIFQNQKVPDIIRKIFSDLKFSDFEFRLYGTYQPRDYCVQYRETDFNFVSRLMEEEGIHYFFDHKDGKHVLILADDAAANKPCPGQKTATCGFQGRGMTYKQDLVTEWQYLEEFRTGAWAQTDYNFQTPSTSLAVTVNGANPYEVYDYPGEHQVRAEGDRLSRIRLQEQTAATKISHGSSTCRAFSCGFQFTLQDHYRKDLNQAYLLTSVRHTATEGGAYGVGTGGGEELAYRNSFECIPYSVPFRPRRVTPQPFVQGCQTAVVVGPGGEEIYTDQHGRVKVQFHWDREGKKNENSSCWIRVSHPWAGQGWGAISIPRIGQEVIVDFLEGNPDQPIIVGRVYNASQTPPFGMPGGAMISGIKSNSTKGGGGYNEFSLNDTKGSELIQVHGQFDMDTKIEHDQRLHVINNRTKNVDVDETTTIGNNRTEHVKVNETIAIDGDRKEDVKGTETITITGDRTETLKANENITITGNRTETVKSDETITVNGSRTRTVKHNETVSVLLTRTHTVGVNEMINVIGAQEISVGAMQTLTVTGMRNKTVLAGEHVTVKNGQSIDVTGDRKVSVTGKFSHDVKGEYGETLGASRKTEIKEGDGLKVGTKLLIDVGDEIELKTGKSSIILNSSGEIQIKGEKISLNANGNVKVCGSKIAHN